MPRSAPPALRPLVVAGARLGCAPATKRAPESLMAIALLPGAAVAGVFTQNKLAGAPTQVCRERLRQTSDIRGIVVNAGVANAGTGRRGIDDAKALCRQYAALLGCKTREVLPASTGVIMRPLPLAQCKKKLSRCFGDLSENNWEAAARAIMTSDSVAKIAQETAEHEGKQFSVVGIAKGVAMARPNMATVLAFVATDAKVAPRKLRAWQRAIAQDTFNAVAVDADTSTNDSFFLIATGKNGRCGAEEKLKRAIYNVCARLAERIVQDGRGASRQLTVLVSGGKSRAACKRLARAVGESPLIKMMAAAQSADIGRLLMAIGNGAKNEGELAHMTVCIGNAPVIQGDAIHPRHDKRRAAAAMQKDEIVISIKLGDSPVFANFKTCDLTREYISHFGAPRQTRG